jgi:predicted MFS family arabinose efflux permease
VVGGRRYRPGDHLSGALALLRRRPGFRALWLALALSYTGSGAALVALTLYVQETQGSGTAVAALLIAEGAPRMLGPLVGGLAERLELRRLMVGVDLAQAAVFGLIALLPPFAVLLGLAAITAILQTTYGPARTTAVPALVEPDELLRANALTGMAQNLYVALGPLIGGLLFAAVGASAALLFNAATFIASALLTTRMATVPPEPHEGGREGILAGARTGFRYAMSEPLTRTVVLTMFAILSFIALDNVALVFLVRDTLGGSAASYGLVSATFGIGMLAASLTIARGSRFPAAHLFLISLLFSTGGTLLTGLAPAIAAVVVAQLVSGSGNGIDIVATETVLHQQVPRRMLGRVAGLLATATSAGMAISMGLGGVIVDATSPRAAFLIAAAGGAVVMVAAAPVLLRAGRG